MYDYQTADPCLYERLKRYARENRNRSTEAEEILWELLRAKQLGVPFKRQHIIGDYIADFVCLPAKLIVEIDGGYHQLPEQQMSDEQRTEWLQRRGYKVLRFINEEIIADTNNVLEKIKQNITWNQ
ncbi:MAG: endonuclease domain-containing protein [Bacteroidaceae bacterium]|nr:endonuclease domain-containing protein [Bacteroidaceae bacterium]